jgi:putative nucleotidyltransferase with HDIG domain
MICPSCQAACEDDALSCAACGQPFQVTLEPGMVVASRYEVQRALGKGGMGTVYKAYDRVLEDTIALKVLRAEVARDPELAWRFQAEIRLARKITHRNVCRVYDYGQDGDIRFISMEFIAGSDLSSLVRAQGGLMQDGAYDVALEIAAGLQAIHDVGILHRDLKSPNIMLDSRSVVRIMDFGISKERESSTTVSGMILGTPEYMSPEQARGDRIGFQSDVYALAIIVFELFTGRLPFRGENSMATLYKQVNEPPPLEGTTTLPAALVPVLRTALAKDPAERYPSARAFADALQQARGLPQDMLMLPPETLAPVAATPLRTAVALKTDGGGSGVSPLAAALDHVTAPLQEGLGLLQLLESVLSAAQGLAGAEASRLLLLEVEPEGPIRVEVCVGDRADVLQGALLAAGEGLSLRAAATGETVNATDPVEEEGYSARVDGLATRKPGFLALPLISGTLRGVLLLAGKEGGFGSRDEADLARLARVAAIALESAVARERALDSFTHTAELLVSFLEKADPRYPMHARSVAATADMIAASLGLSADEQLHIHFAALLHDIGKVGLSPALLRTESELTQEDRRQIQQHVTLGVQLVSPLSPWKELPRIIEAHHERWDGFGYPHGLKGDAIPFGARVLSVADAFDAMTVSSPDRAPEEVLTELQTAAGSQFDPAIVRALDSEHRRRAALFRR